MEDYKVNQKISELILVLNNLHGSISKLCRLSKTSCNKIVEIKKDDDTPNYEFMDKINKAWKEEEHVRKYLLESIFDDKKEFIKLTSELKSVSEYQHVYRITSYITKFTGIKRDIKDLLKITDYHIKITDEATERYKYVHLKYIHDDMKRMSEYVNIVLDKLNDFE